MKYSAITLLLIAAFACAIPNPDDDAIHFSYDPFTWLTSTLDKRRGGGRGGGGTSGRPSSGGGGGGTHPAPNTLKSSNTGGRSSSGSGRQPSFPSGRGEEVYSGGAAVPYRAGGRSPYSGITPVYLPYGSLGFLLYYRYPFGAYSYEYPAEITFMNQTSGKNETLPGTCLCGRYVECSCEVNSNGTYIDALIGDGSYERFQNNPDIQLAYINGSVTMVFNGTLANGTTAASAAGLGKNGMVEQAVWLLFAGVVGSAIWML